ncbi:hypothetical protein DASC09_009830 [Saccharomycopsis crataegensis]|uniref:Uncharacterized protein n=1 Tax=Saccharomycopsis crataegensis TaxID=43959 RepID=A0AAV5QHM8_9ASCO|nr:hypothetical protein DASC09_009830 [Saccharomycopsis crataegensis]
MLQRPAPLVPGQSGFFNSNTFPLVPEFTTDDSLTALSAFDLESDMCLCFSSSLAGFGDSNFFKDVTCNYEFNLFYVGTDIDLICEDPGDDVDVESSSGAVAATAAEICQVNSENSIDLSQLSATFAHKYCVADFDFYSRLAQEIWYDLRGSSLNANFDRHHAHSVSGLTGSLKFIRNGKLDEHGGLFFKPIIIRIGNYGGLKDIVCYLIDYFVSGLKLLLVTGFIAGGSLLLLMMVYRVFNFVKLLLQLYSKYQESIEDLKSGKTFEMNNLELKISELAMDLEDRNKVLELLEQQSQLFERLKAITKSQGLDGNISALGLPESTFLSLKPHPEAALLKNNSNSQFDIETDISDILDTVLFNNDATLPTQIMFEPGFKFGEIMNNCLRYEVPSSIRSSSMSSDHHKEMDNSVELKAVYTDANEIGNSPFVTTNDEGINDNDISLEVDREIDSLIEELNRGGFSGSFIDDVLVKQIENGARAYKRNYDLEFEPLVGALYLIDEEDEEEANHENQGVTLENTDNLVVTSDSKKTLEGSKTSLEYPVCFPDKES